MGCRCREHVKGKCNILGSVTTRAHLPPEPKGQKDLRQRGLSRTADF